VGGFLSWHASWNPQCNTAFESIFFFVFRFLQYQLFLCASLDIQLPDAPASKMPPFQDCSIQDLAIPSMVFIVIK
jgi:hypothetical protein